MNIVVCQNIAEPLRNALHLNCVHNLSLNRGGRSLPPAASRTLIHSSGLSFINIHAEETGFDISLLLIDLG